MKNKKKYLDEEDMKKLDNELTLIPLTFDFMFKGIFMNDLELLKEFILCQLDIDLDPNECKIELLNSELPKENKKEYRKTVDIYVKINDYLFVNIEVNREHFRDVKGRNMLFADKLNSMMLEQGENTKELNNKYFVQLNLNAVDKLDQNKEKIKYGTDKIVLYGLDSKQIYTNNKYTLLKYLEYYRNLYYNEKKQLKESEMWLVSLTSRNFQELYKLMGCFLNADKREKNLRKVIKLCNDKFILSEWEKEKLDELVEITKHENAFRDGIEQQNKEIVKNMIKENYEINEISKITKLEEQEIIKIKESL